MPNRLSNYDSLRGWEETPGSVGRPYYSKGTGWRESILYVTCPQLDLNGIQPPLLLERRVGGNSIVPGLRIVGPYRIICPFFFYIVGGLINSPANIRWEAYAPHPSPHTMLGGWEEVGRCPTDRGNCLNLPYYSKGSPTCP